MPFALFDIPAEEAIARNVALESKIVAQTVAVAQQLTLQSGAVDNKAIARTVALESKMVAQTAAVVEQLTLQSGAVDNKVDIETLDRRDADIGLQNKLNTEALDRSSADIQQANNLDSEICERANADKQLDDDINVEALDRASADADLDDRLIAEVLSRTNADLELGIQLASEARVRQVADKQLDDDINVEALDRASADADLDSRLTAEVLSRTNADLELGIQLASEATVRQVADAEINQKVQLLLTTGVHWLAAVENITEFVLKKADMKVGEVRAVRELNDSFLRVALDGVGGGENLTALESTMGSDFIRFIDSNEFLGEISIVQTDLNNEIALRGVEDSNLQSNITNETAHRTSGDSALQMGLSNETSARSTADATLQTNLNTESTARTTADGTLQSNINQEIADRTAADGTLQSNINQEIADRTAADGTLQSNINQEIADRTAADGTLQNIIDNHSTSINNEIALRGVEDSNLQSNITNETAHRTSGDSALQMGLSNETSARSTADATLQTNLNTESTVRTTADGTLQSNINQEIADRTAADGALQSNINQEIADRTAADTATSSRLTSLTGVGSADTHLGTFTGAIISDSADVKVALQELETKLEEGPPLLQNIIDEAAAVVSVSKKMGHQINFKLNLGEAGDIRFQPITTATKLLDTHLSTGGPSQMTNLTIDVVNGQSNSFNNPNGWLNLDGTYAFRSAQTHTSNAKGFYFKNFYIDATTVDWSRIINLTDGDGHTIVIAVDDDKNVVFSDALGATTAGKYHKIINTQTNVVFNLYIDIINSRAYVNGGEMIIDEVVSAQGLTHRPRTQFFAQENDGNTDIMKIFKGKCEEIILFGIPLTPIEAKFLTNIGIHG